jgi:hypothetical protein
MKIAKARPVIAWARALTMSAARLSARFKVLAALVAILTVAAAPGIANAATAIPHTPHGGSWNITTPFSFTQSNAKYTTHTRVQGCVDATSLTGTLGWHFRVIWWNGGRNTQLYKSPEFHSGGRACSPIISLHSHLPVVYSQETLDCNNPIPLPCQASGTWGLNTN